VSSESTPQPGVNAAAVRDARRPRRILRAALIVTGGSLAAGLAGAVALLVAVNWLAPSKYSGPVAEGAWTARSRACFVASGFYPAELDAESGKHFSWSEATAQFRFPRLDRSHPHRLTINAGAGRPAGVPQPTVRVAVDGITRATVESTADRAPLVVDVPMRDGVGAVVSLDVSPTWTPGPQDARALGVSIDDVTLDAAGGRFQPSRDVVLRTALAVMLAAVGFLLCGLQVRVAASASVAVAIAFAALLATDGAFISPYVDRLVRIGAGIALAGAAAGLTRVRWTRGERLPEWPVAVVILLCATAIKLALFGHPLAQVGDAMFQVHRAQEVHAGRYFFTSITPKPFFEFPYPVALYVAAQPLWRFFPGELNLAFLLRGITLVADALVGFGLYAAARRQWGSARLALFAAALWPLARAPLESVTYANLTNAFGQAVFGIAMGGVGWLAAGPLSLAAAAATCACLVVAFLSHFSTISIGLPVLGTSAAALMAFGKTHGLKAGTWVLILTLAAGAASYGVYYSHFNSVYRQTLSRLLERQKTPETGSKLVAAPSVKLQRWWNSTGDDYGRPGVPLMLTALAGAVMLVRRRRTEGLTIVLLAWVALWAALTALGIFSPVSMRMNLAAAPALVCLAAYALGSVSLSSRPGAITAVLVAAVIGWDALQTCFTCLGRVPGWFI
jgi:hypothetical protein